VQRIETLEKWLLNIAIRLNIEKHLKTPCLPMKIKVVKKGGNEGLLAIAVRSPNEIIICLREDIMEGDENFIKACLIHELTHLHYGNNEGHSKRFLKRSLRVARFLKHWENEELGYKIAELALRTYSLSSNR